MTWSRVPVLWLFGPADDAETAKTHPDAVADVSVDTTGLDFDEVAEAIRAAARNWPLGDLGVAD